MSHGSARVLTLLALSLAGGIAGGPCARAQDAALTPDELIVLNSIAGWGDTGRVTPDRETLAPGNTLGFSLRLAWAPKQGGSGFWAIRAPLPFGPGDTAEAYDGFSFDYRIVSADDGANLSIFLTETDDDRWLCRAGPVADVPKDDWVHVEMPRESMTMWYCGNNQAEWPRVAGVGLEPSGGRIELLLDNLELRGPDGARLPVFTTADEVLPSAAPPRAMRIPPCGTVFLPGLARQNLLDARSAEHFAELLGSLGSAASTEAEATELAAQGAEAFCYSTYSDGQSRFLTRRQGWDVNAAGDSPNTTPFSVRTFTGPHTIAYAHPAVTEAGLRRVESIARAGIGAWVLVDYTFPWSDGPFGYAPAMVDAYRADLAGEDEGLHVRADGLERALRLPEYFASYMGWFPEPADLGLTSWSEFVPPRPDETGPLTRARWSVFLYLRSYEWLKLPDRTGRALQALGGDGTWIIPNPEDTWGSSDYVHLVRSAGTRNLFPEWFGEPGGYVEAGYASLGYLREEADRSGSRFSVLFETGAGGHAAPYWDWRIAYTASYLLTALSKGDDFDNDFLDEATYEVQSDPANVTQFVRFRDGVAKALGFEEARRQQPDRPATDILCVGQRPPAHASGSVFFGLGQRHSLAPALSRAHVAFDLRDSLDLERVLERYRAIVYCPWNPRVGEWERLRAWLEAEPGRVLVTHSLLPTRDARGFWGMESGFDLGTADGGAALGLGRIEWTDAKECTVTAAREGWEEAFPVGTRLTLSAPLTRCEGGEALVETEAGPLLSRVRFGGSTLLYLHTTPDDPAKGDLRPFLVRAMARVAADVGATPVCSADADTPVQVLEVPGGRIVALWDAPTLAKWEFRYEPGIPPLLYAAPGVNRTALVPVPGLGAECRAYDVLEEREMALTPEAGGVPVTLRDRVVGLWVLADGTDAGGELLARAKALRGRMRALHFDEVE